MKRKPEDDKFVATTELRSFGVRYVAKVLSVHPETVRDFLRTKRISGFRVGTHWRVREDVLDHLLRNGVPLACDCLP